MYSFSPDIIPDIMEDVNLFLKGSECVVVNYNTDVLGRIDVIDVLTVLCAFVYVKGEKIFPLLIVFASP